MSDPTLANASTELPTNRSHSRTDWIDPAALMRIKNLQWQAKKVVDGLFSGLHRSPLHGFSVEFSEYRPYTDGDDPKNVDWKLFARSDRYYIKKFEDETNRRCVLMLDQSTSMSYGSLEYSKIEYAKTLAATVAYFLIRQRDAVGLATFADEVSEWLPARFRHGQMQRILSLVDRASPMPRSEITLPLQQLAERLKQRNLLVIISDFLLPLDALEFSLNQLAVKRHEILLLRVLDPNEVTFEIGDPTMLRDLETNQQMYVDPAAVRLDYQAKFAEHATQLAVIAKNCGAGLITMQTDTSLEYALFELLRRRESSTLNESPISRFQGRSKTATATSVSAGGGN